jgi:putative oxidoreductase
MSARSSTLSIRPRSTTSSMEVAGPVVLLGRLFFVLIFLLTAASHFSSQTIAHAAAHGVPLASIAVPLSGVLAIVGGFSILLGYRAKVGAWLLALFLVCVTPVMHDFWAVADPVAHQTQYVMFMKNVCMLGAALLISQLGAGPWSLDARRK